ncbi:MAG TPA: hypothetical protein EYP85_01410 [Armatimonadetes bacterium]|nr:hypothetical protein [Armatimonadota bacterium]
MREASPQVAAVVQAIGEACGADLASVVQFSQPFYWTGEGIVADAERLLAVVSERADNFVEVVTTAYAAHRPPLPTWWFQRGQWYQFTTTTAAFYAKHHSRVLYGQDLRSDWPLPADWRRAVRATLRWLLFNVRGRLLPQALLAADSHRWGRELWRATLYVLSEALFLLNEPSLTADTVLIDFAAEFYGHPIATLVQELDLLRQELEEEEAPPEAWGDFVGQAHWAFEQAARWLWQEVRP